MNFFISLSSRRIINIQYNPSVSNSLKRYKAVNFEPKLRKILDWFSRQWLVALIMHLHCFESACNCKFHYIMNSYNAWLLSEDVSKTCWDWDKIGGDPRLLTCLNFSLTPCHKNLSGTLTEHSSFPFALTANRSLRLLLTLRFALTAVSLSIVIVMLTWYISTFFGTSSESNQALYEFMMYWNLQLHAYSKQWRCIIRATSHWRKIQSNNFLSLGFKLIALQRFNEFETRGLYWILIILLESKVLKKFIYRFLIHNHFNKCRVDFW